MYATPIVFPREGTMAAAESMITAGIREDMKKGCVIADKECVEGALGRQLIDGYPEAKPSQHEDQHQIVDLLGRQYHLLVLDVYISTLR